MGTCSGEATVPCIFIFLNPIALRKAKTPQSFGPSECSRVNK